MKITLEKTEAQDWDFPCLGITDRGTLVLFYEWGKGTLMKESMEAGRSVGHYHEKWDMYQFTPFKGKIIFEQ